MQRAGGAVAGAALAVEHDDVPGAQVVAVIAQARRSGDGAEIIEKILPVVGDVVVIADGRFQTRFEASPGRVETVGIFICPAGVVGGISQQENRAGEAVEDSAGKHIPVAVAECHIAGPDKGFPFREQGVIDHQPRRQQRYTNNPDLYL